jgi:hypothetical protein
MILTLSEKCPIFARTEEAHLQSLLYALCVKRRHILATPDPGRLKQLLPDYLWDLHGVYLTQGSKQAINSGQRWIANADCGNCDASKLAAFCDLPALLIVENASTDGAWIKLIAQKVRPQVAAYFAGTYTKLDIRQAGGNGEIPKELQRAAEQYSRYRPSDSMPLRVIALTDSDAKMPGRPSSEAQAVRKAAERLGARAHILTKRTIENYIPDNSLREYGMKRPDKKSAISVVVNLTPPARDHYPIKGGLEEPELEATGSMYPVNTRPKIGLGDFIIDFINEFGRIIDVNELRRRDGTNELEAILDLIEENV